MIEAFSELVGRDDRTIGVVKFSTRKRWCLIIREAKQIRHLAWFDTEEGARGFCEVLTLVITDDRQQLQGQTVHIAGHVPDPQQVVDEVRRLSREQWGEL